MMIYSRIVPRGTIFGSASGLKVLVVLRDKIREFFFVMLLFHVEQL